MASVAAGYLPILLFLIVALGLSAGFVVLPMLVSRLTGAHKPDPAKLSEYECGFPAFEDARAEFDVRFYLVAILFIVFDLEAAFLFPWAVSLDFTRWTGWVAMMIFLVELASALLTRGRKVRSNGSDARSPARSNAHRGGAGADRRAGPGEVDKKKLEELRQSLNEKGFMVTKAEDLLPGRGPVRCGG